jgi:hypothetical protein
MLRHLIEIGRSGNGQWLATVVGLRRQWHHRRRN